MRLAELKSQFNAQKNLENLRAHQEHLWKWLFGEYTLYKPYTNPLRPDKNKGCSFYIDDNNDLRFNDFAYKNYTLVDYCMEKFSLNYHEAITALLRQLSFIDTSTPIVQKNVIQDFSGIFTPNISSKNTFLDIPIKYCSNIFKLDSYIYNGKLYKYEHSYLYTTPDGGQKIYNPFIEENKWKILTKSNLVDGEWLLSNKYDYLILTTSRKDSCCIRSLGYNNVINPFGSEKEEVNLEFLIKKYNLTINNIFVIADNDKTGIKEASKYNQKVILMPNSIKDPYILYNINKKYLKKWLKKVLAGHGTKTK